MTKPLASLENKEEECPFLEGKESWKDCYKQVRPLIETGSSKCGDFSLPEL